MGTAAGYVEWSEGRKVQYGRCMQQPPFCRRWILLLLLFYYLICVSYYYIAGVYYMIMKNFQRHYNTNRAPFLLSYHPAWWENYLEPYLFLCLWGEVWCKMYCNMWCCVYLDQILLFPVSFEIRRRFRCHVTTVCHLLKILPNIK